MKKTKELMYRTISVSLMIMILLSHFIRFSPIIVKAQDIIEETANQKIENFTASFVSGAKNLGTITQTDFVWTALQPDDGHRFVYQLDYDFSGNGDLSAGAVEMIVPKHIIRDRSGEYADLCEVAVPEAGEVSEGDTENEYVYIDRGNDILIYNRLTVSAAGKGSVQISYKLTETIYEYVDMSQSDALHAVFNINRSDEERLHTVSDAPAVKVDTGSTVKSTKKTVDKMYSVWLSSWGEPSDFGIDTPENYDYLVWNVYTDITATQPYILTACDTVTGEHGDASFVGFKLNNMSAYSSDLTYELRETGRVYSSVITKHLKSTYSPYDEYTIDNSITMSVHPVDNIDPDTSASSQAQYRYIKPIPEYPIGQFNFWKYNHFGLFNGGIANYQLSEFKDGNLSVLESNLDYYIPVVGYAYPWTIEDGYTKEDVDHYGVKPVTYVLTDDEFYFYDHVTANHVPDGTERLGHNDFELTKVGYSFLSQTAPHGAIRNSSLCQKALFTMMMTSSCFLPDLVRKAGSQQEHII